jgi:hypothetical protein
VPPVLWVIVVAAVLRLAYGHGHLGYDAAWSLVWGEELAHGHLPAYEAAFAPTPHPLLNVLAVPLSLLGDGAASAVGVLGILALAGLGWAAFALGRAVATTAAGLVAALLLVTRPSLVADSLNGLSDMLYLTLVLAAVAAETRRPRDGRLALGLLVVAGLIRPEAWILLGLYGLYLLPGRDARSRAGIVAAVAAAPALWLLSDLAVSGDPLHSLHGTRELAEQLARPRSGTVAPLLVPFYVRAILGDAIAWGGALVALAFAWTSPPRSRAALAALGTGLLGFGVLGVAGLPLLARYLLMPAAVLAVLCAVGIAGEVPLRDARARVAVAVALGLAVAIGVPATLHDLSRTRTRDQELRAVQGSLADFVDRSRLAERMGTCGPLSAPSYRLIPLLARDLGAAPATVVAASPSRQPTAGLLVLPASTRAGEALTGAGDIESPLLTPPPGFRRVPGTADWALFENC